MNERPIDITEQVEIKLGTEDITLISLDNRLFWQKKDSVDFNAALFRSNRFELNLAQKLFQTYSNI